MANQRIAAFVAKQVSINVSQVLGAPISLVNKEWYNSWISHTKKSFAVLTMTMTERWAPTVVKVSGDASMRGQLFQSSKGELLCNFPRRLVMIANHQIYTDWLYLWWIAYSNGMHGRIYIILKESLKKIPVIGWGMQLFQFIFLKRNWEADKDNMAKHLERLKNVEDPMWLLLFPEGTNMAPSTREASKKWADKNGIKDLKHLLLPRATGLQFCLQELDETLGYVYDCTIAYDGVPHGKYAQDVYSLQASYVDGKPPKRVNMYWRRFPVSSIPFHDARAFELWLRARWMEKDGLMAYYYRHGQFPADTGREKGPSGRTRRGAGYVNTTIKAHRWYEFLTAFMPMGLMAMILYSFYGSLPESLLGNIQAQSVLDQISQIKKANIPEAQKEAVIRAASQATGVNSVKIQKLTPSTSNANGATKPPTQERKAMPTTIPQSKPMSLNSQVNARRPPTATRITKSSISKKIPKLGPRTQSTSASTSTAPSTTGSIPKLGPRKVTMPVIPVPSKATKQTTLNKPPAKLPPKQKTSTPPKSSPKKATPNGQPSNRHPAHKNNSPS